MTRPTPEFSLTSCQTPAQFLRFGALLGAEFVGAMIGMAIDTTQDKLRLKTGSELARVAITSPEQPQVFVV